MDIFRSFSKILPLLAYPLGLACFLILLATIFQRSRWQKGILILAFILLFLAGNLWVTLQLGRGLEWQYIPPQDTIQADVIIVLASDSLPADFPRSIPEVGEVGDRLIYTAYLYQQGAAPFILHSGGSVTAEIPFLLGIMGVHQEAVLLETGSHNTYENAIACKKVIAEKGFEKIILVTSAAHMPRAVGVFKRLGIEVIPAPTGYISTRGNVNMSLGNDPANFLISLLPSADNLKTTTRMIKEYIGILIYRLRGWM